MLPFLLLVIALSAQASDTNWTAPFPSCANHEEWRKRTHLHIGAYIATASPEIRHATMRALDYWSSVLDMDWYPAVSPECAVAFFDGPDNLLYDGTIARAQYPDDARFEGWIIFNPDAPLTDREWYFTAIHEIGHMLGLLHSEDRLSVMSMYSFDGQQRLDRSDRAELAARHELRRHERDTRLFKRSQR